MRESNKAVQAYLSRGDLPKEATILDWDEVHSLSEKVSAESGEPLESGATVVKLDRSERGIAKLISVVFIFGLGLFVWYLLRDGIEVYIYNPHWIVTPSIVLVAASGIAFFAILHAGFSDFWLILEEDRARFRVRRALRYRVENFPFASIEEVAIEIFPSHPRRGELARLAVVRNARQVELFRGQVEDGESGGIALAAELLGAASGLPVTRRRIRRFREAS